MRLFILSDSPPEKDVQWSDEGIAASYKFIQKLWNLNLNILEQIKKNHKKDTDDKLYKITNNFINKVTNNLSKFSYNKIIANFYEIYSELSKILVKEYSSKTILENYSKILICMLPVIPHYANECIKLLKKEEKEIKWPDVDQNVLKEEIINYVVQINGKKRGLIESNLDVSEQDLLNSIYENPEIKKYLEGNKIKKKIFIPNKLINIII